MNTSATMAQVRSIEDRKPLRFVCRCGADVFRPESTRFDDRLCLNCRFGRAEAQSREVSSDEIPASESATG